MRRDRRGTKAHRRRGQSPSIARGHIVTSTQWKFTLLALETGQSKQVDLLRRGRSARKAFAPTSGSGTASGHIQTASPFGEAVFLFIGARITDKSSELFGNEQGKRNICCKNGCCGRGYRQKKISAQQEAAYENGKEYFDRFYFELIFLPF